MLAGHVVLAPEALRDGQVVPRLGHPRVVGLLLVQTLLHRDKGPRPRVEGILCALLGLGSLLLGPGSVYAQSLRVGLVLRRHEIRHAECVGTRGLYTRPEHGSHESPLRRHRAARTKEE